ncbi:hypothetical protein GC722_08285 [Auraticoccus sp. F435]|uniref:Phosphotransferase n=1 Tax=Auraticoccus cholistanensis TaxID=2656650 RepID=A0A6A9V0Q1_9ACTN|nr:hypothetical protein [Auraticoccus cholistanensis]MVA76019.1 hypothetical protein [Auraticoccus cholistanensis]
MPDAAALPPTYLRTRRTSWADAPAPVQQMVRDCLGEPVRSWKDRVGGMSAGVAAVVRGETRAVFVKALDGAQNPVGHEMYLREAALADRLPRSPHLPRLVGTADVATSTGPWAVGVYAALPGEPVRHPWSRQHLHRVLDAWQRVTPLLHATAWETSAEIGGFLDRWRLVLEDPRDPWLALVRSWAPRLAATTARVDGDAEHPAVLSHIDLRADNILVGEPTDADDPGVWFVDWAHPGTAAPWVDPAILLGDVVASGADLGDGGAVDVVGTWREHPATAGYDPELLLGVVAALAVALHVGSRRPPNPVLPHQRGWERAMADAMRPFLERHAG